MFRLEAGVLVQVDSSLFDSSSSIVDSNFLPSSDNSQLRMNSNAQKLTRDEIMELKKTMSGEEVVALLAANRYTSARRRS